jgi:hypothetical protein
MTHHARLSSDAFRERFCEILAEAATNMGQLEERTAYLPSDVAILILAERFNDHLSQLLEVWDLVADDHREAAARQLMNTTVQKARLCTPTATAAERLAFIMIVLTVTQSRYDTLVTFGQEILIKHLAHHPDILQKLLSGTTIH